jgi:hypothetical protein
VEYTGCRIQSGSRCKTLWYNNARERFLAAEETQRLRDAVEKSKNPQLKTSQRHAHLSQETLLAAIDAATKKHLRQNNIETR